MSNNDLEKDITELTPEERAKAWEDWVKKGINEFLDLYLPFTIKSDINFKYSYEVKEELESGTVYDENKVNAVLLSLLLEFENPIDVIKNIKE